MRCTKCGTDNQETAKFCGECAAPLPHRCPNCGYENPAKNKFCSECAKPLSMSATAVGLVPQRPSRDTGPAVRIRNETEASGALEGERKTVTALFADIKGSMELIEDLDPEEARAIVDPALKLMMDAVHRYEGYVAQSTGDGISHCSALRLPTRTIRNARCSRR
jgi:hypothetical protein